MKKFSTIYLDMDQVLVDFDLGAAWFFGIHPDKVTEQDRVWDLTELFNVSWDEFHERVNVVGEDFWANLPELPWYEDLFQLAYQYTDNVCILTSPSDFDYTSCAIGKRRWLMERGYHNELFVVKNKQDFASKGSLLIDDRKENCQAFCNAGGMAVLFPSYANQLASEVGRLKQVEKHMRRLVGSYDDGV